LLINVITWEHLLFIQPTPNPTALEVIEQAFRKGLVIVAVADKAREELDSLIQERW
jgi:hypothetical protein